MRNSMVFSEDIDLYLSLHFIGQWCCNISSFQCMQHNTLERQFSGKLTDTVEPHSCKMYVLKPIAWVSKDVWIATLGAIALAHFSFAHELFFY